MNRDEIMAMAREAGGYESPQYPENLVMDEHDLSRFAALVAAKEQERLFGKAQRDGEMRLILHRWEDGRCFAAAAHFGAEQTHCGPDDLLQIAVGRLDDSLDASIAAAICARGQKEGA